MKYICHHLRFYAVAIVILLISFCGNSSYAQCKIFSDADAANPLLNAIPAPQNITGLQFIDIDGDSDLDCYIVSNPDTFELYRNVGTTKRAEFVRCHTTGFENVALPATIPAFAFADLDGDGDNDCIIQQLIITGTRFDHYNIRYLQNVGTAQQPLFADADGSAIFGSVDTHPGFGYTYFTFADIDGDGDKDFYYTQSGLAGTFGYTFLNTSTTAAPLFTFYSSNTYYGYQYRSFYDFNYDGLPDAIDNDGAAGYHYLENFGSASGPFYIPTHFTLNPPDFEGGIAPYTFTDLNGDGAPEAFNYSGHYTTVAPVAVINKNEKKTGNYSVTRLSASAPMDGYTYQWEYNGKIVPGYHKPFIYALKKGAYVLSVTDSCGTGVSLPYSATDSTLMTAGYTTSSQDLMVATNGKSVLAAAKAYPNPFSSEKVIQIPAAGKTEQSLVKITNLAGRTLLLQSTMAASVTTGRTLQKGTYLVDVWKENKLVYHVLVMKQ